VQSLLFRRTVYDSDITESVIPKNWRFTSIAVSIDRVVHVMANKNGVWRSAESLSIVVTAAVKHSRMLSKRIWVIVGRGMFVGSKMHWSWLVLYFRCQ
jgi:hypothetical protein